ncbi:hypothetical protein F383_19471 [Gossypium arboreum]|uniref:Uncharacterized protein n=1 Tax=Gossypium arboreum TaxID=29729 RepID=A0A0B0M9W6_GOSAR|nr:hypothetical protein F383_19471 [Gossypium arboreum]
MTETHVRVDKNRPFYKPFFSPKLACT